MIVVDDGSTDNTWQAIRVCWLVSWAVLQHPVEPSQNKGRPAPQSPSAKPKASSWLSWTAMTCEPEHLARAKAAFRQNGGKAGLFAGRADLGSTRFMHESVWPSAEPQPASQLLHACYFLCLLSVCAALCSWL